MHKYHGRLIHRSRDEHGSLEIVDDILTRSLHFGNHIRQSAMVHQLPDHRLRYARGVQPKIIHGRKCLVVDLMLRQENPAAYEYVLAFAKANQLRMQEISADDGDDDAA